MTEYTMKKTFYDAAVLLNKIKRGTDAVPYQLMFDLFKSKAVPDVPVEIIHDLVCNEYLNHFTKIKTNDIFVFATRVDVDMPLSKFKFEARVASKAGGQVIFSKFDVEQFMDGKNRGISFESALGGSVAKKEVNISCAIDLPFGEGKELKDIESVHNGLIAMAQTLQAGIDRVMEEIHSK